MNYTGVLYWLIGWFVVFNATFNNISATYIHEYVVGTSQLPVIALRILYMKQLNCKLKNGLKGSTSKYKKLKLT
jgi:hypothetical protein